jgi:predicted porin
LSSRSLIAAAACMVATATMAEDNVTMYGIVDVGFETLSNQASGGRSTFMAGGGSSMPSLWGFRGKEDLGGGLSASFNLEGGLDASQGTIANSNGGIFGRQAHVGLSGGWGAVKLGLQLNPAFISAVQTDPRGGAQSFSILPFWIGSNVAAGEGSKKSAANIFESSAITYSYSAAGFSGTLLYSVGGGPGSANRIVSTGLSYHGGPLFVTGGAYRNNTSMGASGPSGWNLGASYAVTDALSIKGTHLDVKGRDATGAHFATTGFGASYAMGPVTYNVAYYLSKDKAHGGDAKLLTFGMEYALSKRTALYAQAVSAKQSSTGYRGAGLLDVNGGSFTAGKSVSGVALGVRNLF